MKLSQTRLREIIQEEVARMNEDEHSRRRGLSAGDVYTYVTKNYRGTDEEKMLAGNQVVAKIKSDSGEVSFPLKVTYEKVRNVMKMYPPERMPRRWTPSEELDEVDTSGVEAMAAISPDLGRYDG